MRITTTFERRIPMSRIVEKMEEIGIVGELESNGKREVLAPPPPED